jgi:hypothetical protein
MSTHERHLCQDCLNKEYESFRHACVHESMAKNDIWLTEYRINDWPRWDYSMEEATLTFSQDKKAKVVCDIQVVGTTVGDSWEWAWGNQNLPDACRHLLCEIHLLGKEKGWEKLTTLFLDNDEYLGWECTSIANHVLNGIGSYRCPNSDESGFVYVVILSSRFVN